MNEQKLNGYELSRDWFDFCFENPERTRPIHTAIYFFAIEHCNRLGWKEKFGFPSQMVMEAIGVKNWRTYSKAFNKVVSIPTGGDRLKLALDKYVNKDSSLTLICDDVFTTGNSMYTMSKKIDEPSVGAVIFARTLTPRWIYAVFVMS
ncbi:hypothetical protein LCGC14_0371110 [marine sediment metagenome]|uniref:Phosphoribosyltransferase domain-containing protein n=1 Tax=marine sediment metagenome TaxID=412755 RepID=A0A0F9T5D6_9ZZZZ|nr:hypothetical protein [Maribacter sp.]HDZ04867.1 hypothetical protein [Maribacter sp.]